MTIIPKYVSYRKRYQKNLISTFDVFKILTKIKSIKFHEKGH